MVKDEIKMKNMDCDIFDKKQIALAIRNSALCDELECSLREEKIINNCKNCNLKIICEDIDNIREDYVKSTSTVVKDFNL